MADEFEQYKVKADVAPIDDDFSQYKATNQSMNNVDDAQYLDQLPSPPGFFAKLPRNILVGLAKLGHSTLNLPHDLLISLEQSGAKFDRQLPQAMQQAFPESKFKLSEHVPFQKDYNFAEMLGQQGEGTLMDQLIQKGVEYAPEILTGKALLKGGLRRLTGTHQLKSVEDAANAAKNLGISNFYYSPQTTREAIKYMPKTEATKQLVMRSQSGEYPASFSLQSQLGKYQRDLSKSPLASERLLAPRVSELRQNMLNELEAALKNSGMDEEAKMLRTGIKNYAQYMRVRNAVMPVIKKLGIPTTIAASIGFGYQKGKKLLKD